MSRVRLGAHVVPVALVAASVAVGALLVRDRGATDPEREARAGRVFPSWRRDQVTRVALSTSAGELGLDRDPQSNTWKLHGTGVGADGAAADRLLGELESAVALRRVDDAVAAGLASPRARGEIAMGGMVYTFALGAEAKQPAGAAYLRVDGERPVVVEPRLVTALLAPPSSFRDKVLVPASGAELAELSLAPRGAARFTLLRDGKVRFRRGAGGAYASRAAVDAALSALGGLHAERFLEAAAGEPATRDPTLVVSLRESPGASSELAFGQPCPGAPEEVAVVRRGNAPVYACVPAGVAAVLARSEEVYEERGAFFARPDEVEEIVVKRAAGAPLDVARKGGGFRERAPGSRDLDASESESVSGWLAALLALKGAPSAALAASEPVAVVTLHYAGIQEEVRFTRAAGPDGKVVALRGDGRAVELDATAADLAAPPSALTRGLALFPTSGARALKGYELFCEGRAQRVVREGGYRFAPPGPHPIDPALAVAAANALVGARAERWVADARSPRHPISPTCGARLSFEGDAGPGEVTIELGDRATAPVFGALGGEAAVFEVPADLVELVRRPLGSRALFTVDPARVSAVVVRRGGALVGNLTATDGGPSLVDLVGGLRPLFVARSGALGADAGQDPVDVEITLAPVPGGKGERARLRLGRQVTAPEGEVVLCAREGVPFVFAVRAERVAGLRGAAPATAAPPP